MKLTSTVVLVRERDGRYWVSVRALRGCHTWGDTLPEGLQTAEDHILAYLEGARELGKPESPTDVDTFSGALGDVPEASVHKVPVDGPAEVA